MGGLIFLDRDGVINEDHGDYVTTLADWRPIPGSLDAVARIAKAGWDVVIVTNQSALARGLLDESTLFAIHTALHQAVEHRGGRIAAIMHCPHHPRDGCSCRKPAPGMVHEAERVLGRSARGAPLIGDKLSDLDAARAAGCRPMLVRTGQGSWIDPADPGLVGAAIHSDLAGAVDTLLTDALSTEGGR